MLEAVLIIQFQFLDGSIKSPQPKAHLDYLRKFQFLDGSIKRFMEVDNLLIFLCFNSLMVRLKAGAISNDGLRL